MLRACTGLQLSAEGAACRTRWGAGDSFVEAAGRREKGRFASFDALIKGRGRTRLCTGCTIPFCGQTSPQVCCRYVCRRVDSNLLPDTRQPTGMPAAFTGEEIPCRPKGRPAFRGGPRKRDFSRKKRFCLACVLAASEICLTQISTPRFWVRNNPPAGRPRAFASYRRALFMGHSVRVLSTEDRPAHAGSICPLLVSAWERIFRTPPA